MQEFSSFAARFLLGLVAFVELLQLPITMADCPLDLSGANLTLTATLCSDNNDRGKCCRSINAFVAISVTRYANETSILGVSPNLSRICVKAISKTLKLYGVPRNAIIFCGLGKKILVNYECNGRTTVTQMMQSPKFVDVVENCKVPLAEETTCWKCLNAGSVYLHHLVGTEDNLTLSTCRDATFAAIANQVDDVSALDIANCFFGVQGHNLPESGISSLTPEASPSNFVAASPSQILLGPPLNASHHPYRLTLLPGVGLAVTVIAVMMLVVLIFLIRRKNRELDNSEGIGKTNGNSLSRQPIRKFEEGPSSMFCEFSYRETKKATGNFNTVIGQGGFGTVYKAQFSDGLVAAVKRMNKVSEQGKNDFCREIDLLARLNHRHLVTLLGFCIVKNERFLMYEYMTNGSLKDHLHSPVRTPLSWQTRIQIAIDVANALEYLHFYCDPPLCHRDIKSSNILLDANFVAKVADFGLLHASKDGSIFFEPVNTDIRGTPGYMDPEYVVTQELTEKSDIYSYGVLLLEIVTARRVIQDNKNIVEWSQNLMASESRIPELLDPRIRDSFNFDQLQTIVSIVKWCTQRKGQDRPSIKQVLRLLYESSDPMYSGFLRAVEDEEYERNEETGKIGDGKTHKSDMLASSSSTSTSHCSRNFLLETRSPQSPATILSV